MKTQYENITEATDYIKTLGLTKMTTDDAKTFKVDDLMKIMIYNIMTNEITFSLVSTVKSIVDGELIMYDVETFFEPDNYSSVLYGEEKWEIRIGDVGTRESHTFFFEWLGVLKDFPEYLL